MLRVKRRLKKARLFEIQKLTRRLKMLERKRGTQSQVHKNRRKAGRLLKELEIIKDLNLSDLAGEVVATKGTFVAVPVRLKTHSIYSSPPSDLSERARWRLLSSNVFQNWSLEEAAQRVAKRERLPESEGIVGVTDGQLLVGDQLFEQNDDELSEQSEQDSLNDTCESVVTSEEQHSDSEPYKCTPAEETSQKRKRTRRIGQISRTARGRTSGAKRKVKGTTSTSDPVPESCGEDISMDSIFLDCLAVSREESQPGKWRKPNHQKKRNRPGQRARQKEWEALYGAGAKHLKEKHHSQKKKTSSSKGSRVATRHAQRDGAAGEQPAPDQTSCLHPSWAASRKRKAQEGGIMEFQGKRVVFSDSD